ncbi:hypothetical protein B9Z65_7129 [Elsinoe australis]|uniref:Uncharacterized protein n=1 Tax=Elsinoe australis TaxID=40998 RepID=A0A2P7Z5Z0_9PEZI|nr:hypothetical protein B9Z65_7129 [Elsinoe australis]
MPTHLGEMQSTTDLHNLVEAATTAASQEHFKQNPGRISSAQEGLNEHPRHSSSGQGIKRKRSGIIAHNDKHGKDFTADEAPDAPPSSHVMDDHHQGSHKASAMFRKPGKAKKQTRPAISSMYASLQLSPESFLTLQSVAKVYMLDPENPERLDCIGVRGKGDGKGVRLDLARYVREFLEHGAGERFFGVDSDPPGDPGNDFEQVIGPLDDLEDQQHAGGRDELEPSEAKSQHPRPGVGGPAPRQEPQVPTKERSFDKRGFLWPQDKDKIIKLCMPLLRRIVSNEKQRQYALESRKAGRGPQRMHRADELDLGSRGEIDFVDGASIIQSSNTTVSLNIFFVDSEDMNTVRRSRRMTLEGNVSTAWERVQDAIGHDMAKEVRVQTQDGLVRITDEMSCQDSVTEVLKVPWFENMVSVVVIL